MAWLVHLDTSRLFDSAAALPSVETFAAQQGLEGFSDQGQAWAAAFGNHAQPLRRRARLVERQLEALRWLEPSRTADSVTAWLNPVCATKLETADVFGLHELAEHVNGLGLGWHTSIHGIGATKAQRIVEWLRAHEDALGQRIGAHVGLLRSRLPARALHGVVAAANEVWPLGKIVVPAELNGSQGPYR